MKTVGIKKLKNELSRYLKMVQQGEVLYVTDNDEVIAEIQKPVTPASRLDPWEIFLNQQERAGLLKRAKRERSLALQHPTICNDGAPIDWQKILKESREDRF